MRHYLPGTYVFRCGRQMLESENGRAVDSDEIVQAMAKACGRFGNDIPSSGASVCCRSSGEGFIPTGGWQEI